MAIQTTLVTPKAMHLDQRGYAVADILPEFLGLVAGTICGQITGDEPALLIPFVSFDGQAGFIQEGQPIPVSSPDDSQVVVHTGKVAVLATVSSEQYGIDDTSTLFSDSIRRSVLRKANQAFLAQVAPTSPAVTPPAGLLHLGPADGGTITADGNLDALTDAIATIEANWGTATTLVASPDAWSNLSKLKVADTYNATLLGSGTMATQRMLASLPVYVSASCPTGTLLVIDRTAVLVAAGQVMLAVSADAGFAADAVAVRVTFRFGQALVNSSRVVRLTVTGA